MKPLIYFFLALVFLIGCSTPKPEHKIKKEAQQFLETYTKTYKLLYYESSEAEWAANTKIVPGDTLNAYNVQETGEAMAAFTGSKEVIEQTSTFLEQKELLDLVQIRQLEGILYSAAGNPQTVAHIVSQKIAASAAQDEVLFGFDYKVDGESVTTGDIDGVLKTSTNEEERLKNWEASKEVGIDLKDGLENLVSLRNQTVQALGYSNYFSYQVSDYGMTRGEMMVEMKKMVQDIWPLYRELHTWARYHLAYQFKQDVPDYLPAHWLPNRWGQDWGALVNVEGLDVDGALKNKDPEWIVKEGEDFFCKYWL